MCACERVLELTPVRCCLSFGMTQSSLEHREALSLYPCMTRLVLSANASSILLEHNIIILGAFLAFVKVLSFLEIAQIKKVNRRQYLYTSTEINHN